MAMIHYQRLSVLLFCACGSYSISYLLMPSLYSMSYVYDNMCVSTTIFSSCLILDSISLSFSVVVTYISSCVFFFSRSYMASDLFYYRFTWILMSFVGSMNMLILSGSLFTMLLGWDGLGVSSFALIMYYQSRESLVASFLTLLVNRLGDIMIMSSMVVFMLMGSTLIMHYSTFALTSLMLLLSVAALTKSAQYPFCAWLPAAMAAPTPVSALVHSSTLVTAGVYILIRACSTNLISPEIGSMLLFFGSVTTFIGGCCAVYENDLKKLVALSTLSQLGVMMFSLGLGLHFLALLHLFTHAMFKALLFLVAGCILMLSYGVQDIRLLGGLTTNNPLLLVFLNISAFCLMGLPFLSAFYSKHMILAMMWMHSVNTLSVVLMLLSTGLSCVYMVRLLKNLNWGPTHSSCVMPPASFGYYTPLFLLFFGSCFLGWFFSLLDLSYTMSICVGGVYDIMIYFVMMVGIMVGLVLRKSHGSELLSTLFYMSPVWYNINFFSYKFTRMLKCLDGGWLEPYTYKVPMMSLASLLSIESLWPRRSLSLFPYFLLSISLMFMMWFFLS